MIDPVPGQGYKKEPNLMAALGNRPMGGAPVTPTQPVGNNPYTDPGFSQPASMSMDDFFKWADTQTSTPAQIPTLAPGTSKSYEELMQSTPGFSTPSGGTAVGAPVADPGGHQAMIDQANKAFGERENPNTPTVDPAVPGMASGSPGSPVMEATAAGAAPVAPQPGMASGSPGSPVMEATAAGAAPVQPPAAPPQSDVAMSGPEAAAATAPKPTTPPVSDPGTPVGTAATAGTPTLQSGDLDTFFREADGVQPGQATVTQTSPQDVAKNTDAWLAQNAPNANFPQENAVRAVTDAFNTGGFDAFFKQADQFNQDMSGAGGAYGGAANEVLKDVAPPPAGGIGIPAAPTNNPVVGDMAQPGTQAAVDQTATGGAPVVDQPAITDYSEALKEAGIPAAIEALGAANPYDVRRDEILGGQQAMIDEEYKKARELLVHQAGVMNRLESPAFAANLKELTNDYTLAKLGLQSQFGREAAAADEGIRRGRVQDVLGAIDPEFQRTQTQLGSQAGLQSQANQDYMNYMGLYNAAQQQPANQQAQLLQLGLQGLGYTTPASFGQTMAGLGSVANTAGAGMAANAANVSNIFQSPFMSDLLGRIPGMDFLGGGYTKPQ